MAKMFKDVTDWGVIEEAAQKENDSSYNTSGYISANGANLLLHIRDTIQKNPSTSILDQYEKKFPELVDLYKRLGGPMPKKKSGSFLPRLATGKLSDKIANVRRTFLGQ